MIQETPPLISAVSIATEILYGIDHRVYYTCIKNKNDETQTQSQPLPKQQVWNCRRGIHYFLEDPSKKFEHVCVFAGKPGNTQQETYKNLDTHFETKFPNHKVVQSLHPR